MEWVALALGIASLIGGIVTSIKGVKKEEETTEYNKELNQTVMDREDNAWQRAVKDRSQAGLSIAGLTQGSGSGGTVSQLQSSQSMAQMSNLFQNFSSQSFGLAMNAYDSRKARELQKDNFMEELEVKKEELKNSKLNSYFQRLMLLNEMSRANSQEAREAAIYSHNMKIAKGESDNPLASVYGSQPSDIERIINGLSKSLTGNNVVDNVKTVTDGAKSNVENFTDSLTGNSQQQNMDQLKNKVRPELYNLIKQGNNVQEVIEENGKYYVYTKNKYNPWSKTHKTQITKQEFDIIYDWFEKQRKK